MMVTEMLHHGKNSCFNALLGVGGAVADRDSQAMRRVIDDVLACDKLVRCSDRLECTWLASQMADSMRNRQG